jgi:hypothetical protein
MEKAHRSPFTARSSGRAKARPNMLENESFDGRPRDSPAPGIATPRKII